jgi:hypothetical protein
MGKQLALKLAEEYVLRHKKSCFARSVTKKQIREAVQRVAKALQELGPPNEKLKDAA